MTTEDLTAELVARSATVRRLLQELTADIRDNTPDGHEPDPFTGWLNSAALMVSEVEAHVKRGGLYVPAEADKPVPVPA